MVNLILLALLLLILATVAGIVYAFRKLPLRHFCLLLCLFVALPFGWFKVKERELMLNVVPDALQVSSIAYSKEESWGFGPGGNEAGIRVYPLPEPIAAEISRRGLAFFDALPPNQDQQKREWRGMYSHWSETPVRPGPKRWKSGPSAQQLDIYDYICLYGFCIDIDPVVVAEANEAINSAGSYYAYGRIGMIVVSPGKQRVLYMYNG